MSTDAVVIEATPPQSPATEAAELTRPKPQPVSALERVASVDVLRGVALLGILTMNIVFFAWPAVAVENPLRGGGDFTGFNRVVWAFNHLIFDWKMMTIFSMLFGAGLVLMGGRADARGAALGWVYYRRVFWLLVIGALHAYLLSMADVLVLYAQCGMVLYPLRRLSARTLIILAIPVLLMFAVVGTGVRTGLRFLENTAAKAQDARSIGGSPSKFQAWIHELWTETLLPRIDPSPERKVEVSAKESAVYRGSYAGIVRHNATEIIEAQTIAFFLTNFWVVGGRMLLGMGLMKLGVFSAARSWRFYGWMVALGYGLGLPLVGYDCYALVSSNFFYKQALSSQFYWNHVGSIAVALGHVGVVMLICKAGALPWLRGRLAAVGRMALTNYLMQSVICTTLFYGWGFGLFAAVDRAALAGIVFVIWVVQLPFSWFWLAHFRFGPAEWLWRSLTYWRLQPMRREFKACPA